MTTFTAGETERITGVSAATQRDWRRRDYLPSGGEGWMQHDVMSLSRLTYMQALQDRGIGPAISSQASMSVGMRIAFFALSWPDAIEDQTGGEFERISKKMGMPLASHFVTWPVAKKPAGPREERFFIAWPNGQMDFVGDLRAAFSGSQWDEKYHGAILLLDLEAMGTLIANRAGRPLVTVESDTE